MKSFNHAQALASPRLSSKESPVMDTSVLALTLVIAFIVLTVVAGFMRNARKDEMEARLRAQPDFTPTRKIVGCDGQAGLAVDEGRHKLCLVSRTAAGYAQRILPSSDLLSVELFEDGTLVTRTVRSSQIAGALLGGMAYGSVGAIIGGLSGRTETSNRIERVDLRLVVNDTASPLHDVAFMNAEGEKDGIDLEQARRQARHWHGILDILIKRADAELRDRQPAPAPQTASVADELGKLAGLRTAGLLTDEEFARQKEKLLANS